MTTSSQTKQQIIILGAGFAGFRLAKELNRKYFDVTLISPRNYFLFTPLLTSTTVGTIEFRSIIEPIRSSRPLVRFFQARAVALDPKQKTLTCEDDGDGRQFSLSYDHLIIAVGAENNTYGVPGVYEHCFFLKDLPDARSIRRSIIDVLEHASNPALEPEERKRRLQVIIIGGGPTGIEFAGELHDFVQQDLSRWFPELAGELKIIVLEAANDILSTFDQRLKDYTLQLFKKHRVEIRTQATVIEIKHDCVILAGGNVIDFGVAVWSAGVAPTTFVEMLPFRKDSRGRLLTNGTLEVDEAAQIYALGDCAAIEGRTFPQTAQLAEQQGKYLGRVLNRKVTGKTTKPFTFRNMGMLAYIGGRRALADLPGVKGRGFFTWLLWRSVYLTKIVSLKNRILVLFDWFKTSVFGRDVSKF